MGNEAGVDRLRSILYKAHFDFFAGSAPHPMSVQGNKLLPAITATALHASVLL